MPPHEGFLALHETTQMLMWKDLTDYVEKKCDFKQVDGKTTWKCKGMEATKEFCDQHHLDFRRVQAVLNNFGGFCDCEVVFNAAGYLDNRPITADLDRDEVKAREIIKEVALNLAICTPLTSEPSDKLKEAYKLLTGEEII